MRSNGVQTLSDYFACLQDSPDLFDAKQDIYSPYAFRRQGYHSDDRYFSVGAPAGSSQTRRAVKRYFLVEHVREKVNFRRGNILDSQLLVDQPPYDVVFCRNLLLCFDQTARDRTFAKLNQVLHPNGVLFLGCAETTLVDRQHYQPVPYPNTFAYYKTDRGSYLVNQAQGITASPACT
ncbi:MAG: CheR family methyltransferase [Cyanobacteria bacterium P01_D01_bin.1]